MIGESQEREDGNVVPPLPPNAPRVRANAFTRWLGRAMLRLGGWRVVGAFPDEPRLVVIGAPHSSNWDGIWGIAAKLALGLELRLLGKDALFHVPLLGWVLRRLGAVPVDRSASHGVVGQSVALLRDAERMWIGLTPEGTRRRVARWRTGFWKIARAAGVPILPVYFHYPRRIIGIGAPVHPGDDMEADIASLRAWYREVAKGRNRDV